MTPETDSAIAGVSGTITDLAQQQLSAEQIHQIGASRIRALITQIPQINASQYPSERRQLEHIRTNIKTRIDLIQVAIEVAQTRQNAGHAKELEQTRSALTDLNDALALQGVIKQRFAEGGTVGEVAGRAIGTLETAGDRLGILLRDQSTPVQIAANAGLIAAGAAVLWIIWRNAETGVLRIGAGLATVLGVGAAYLGIPAVRNMFDNMAQRMQKTQKEYAAQLKSAQELKELNATIEKNRAQTEEFFKQFNALRTSTSQGELGAVIGQAQAAVKIEKDLLTDATIGRFPEPRQKVLRDRIQALDKALADLATEQSRLNTLRQPEVKKTTVQNDAVNPQAAVKIGNEPVSKANREPTGAADRKLVQDQKIKNDEMARNQRELEFNEKNGKLALPPNPSPTLSPEQMERKRILDQISFGVDLADGREIELRRGLKIRLQRSPPGITVNGVRWQPQLEQVYEPVSGSGFWRGVSAVGTNVARGSRGAAVTVATALGALQIATVMRTNEGFRLSGSIFGIDFPRNPNVTRAATLEEILPYIEKLEEHRNDRTFNPLPHIDPMARQQVIEALGAQRIMLRRVTP